MYIYIIIYMFIYVFLCVYIIFFADCCKLETYTGKAYK